MNHYKKLAFRYLKMNKRRSRVTVMGVAAAVAVLYALLNLGWSALLQYREKVREEKDYELIFLTETAEQAEQLMADEKIKSAYVGPYYDGRGEEPVQYENALYVNLKNPYRMNAALQEFGFRYGVDGVTNYELEMAYMQGDQANGIFVATLGSLLVSMIFAIFGIGIVRNSIQMSTLEQIKDYGNLRCIGASKGQLKSIVYLEGTILEVIGNGIGVLIGGILSMAVGRFLDVKVGFHIIPALPVLGAFLGDLYFAMEDNCRVIANLTPVSAIRGEYRIRREKFKLRRKSIFGRLFGIEGDYAYKSIMRNPFRFFKTVWAIGIGIAAVITAMGFYSTMNAMIKDVDSLFGYYKVFYDDGPLSAGESIDDVQSMLPDVRFLEAVSDMNEVDAAKQIYSARVLLTDGELFYGHLTESYLEDTEEGEYLKFMREMAEGESDVPKTQQLYMEQDLAEVTFSGYDEEDYERYEPALVDGTLDISENGVVLVNGGEELAVQRSDNAMVEDALNRENYIQVTYTDYKVGDTIDLLDMERYRTLLTQAQEILNKKYQDVLSDSYDENARQYYLESSEAAVQVREQMLREGSYKTYTIEGIVSEEVNMYSSGPQFILPLEQYYTVSGTDETMMVGMRYHFKRFSASRFYDTLRKAAGDGYDQNVEDDYTLWTPYAEYVSMFDSMKNVFRFILLVIGFIVMMSTFNIINTTAGNLYLRRKEFAQLRVIGVSKKQLMRMVMLEGMIATVVANGIGVLLGVVIHRAAFDRIYALVFDARFRFPVAGMLCGLFVSALILCGAVYVPLKGLKLDMASDLATGGE